MSELFRLQMECKKAYYAYMEALIQMEKLVLNDKTYGFTDQQILNYLMLNDAVWDNLMNDRYTTEEALNQTELRKSEAYMIANGGQGIVEVLGSKPIVYNPAIYDLSGRQIVNGQLKEGIYIINGKKVLVK